MRLGKRYGVRLEWKPQDLWIGAYWCENNLWVCIVPCLPIHFARIPKSVKFR